MLQDYLQHLVQSHQLGDAKRLLETVDLPKPCLNASTLGLVLANMACLLAEHRVLINPRDLIVDPQELLDIDASNEHFELFFKPTSRIVSHLTLALSKGRYAPATVIWRAMSEKQRTRYVDNQLTKWNKRRRFDWMIANGIKPRQIVGGDGDQKTRMANFYPIADGVDTIQPRYLFTTEHQTVATIVGIIQRCRKFPNTGSPKYIQNNTIYRVFKTTEGEVAIDRRGQIMESVDRVPLKRSFSHAKLSCYDVDNPRLTAQEVKFLIDNTFDYPLHMIDQDDLYYELADENTVALLIRVAIHCNNLRALQYLLESTTGINIPKLIVRNQFNDCVEYLIGLCRDPNAIDEIVFQIAKEIQSQTVWGYVYHIRLLLGAIPELRGRIGVMSGAQTAYGEVCKYAVTGCIERLARMICRPDLCQHTTSKGVFADGMEYCYFVPAKTLLVKAGDTWVTDDERIDELPQKRRAPKSARLV